jgi:hypothetical protein
MRRIARGVYLGDCRDANDRELLRGLGLTHVLNCAREVPCFHRGDFRYLHLRMRDPDPGLLERIPRAVRFIRRARRVGGVLVHCRAGLSRSPSVVLAWLCSRGRTLDEALELLRRRVEESQGGFIEPDPSFLDQLETYCEFR